uniref:Mitochondrial import inner membrane translocase subunit n=1 Tax=Moschus moschiferus TaxID=68415 RepID=A0A8C6CHJ8_MOSMO
MEGGFGSDFGGSGGGKLDPGLIMEQVKVQIAVANAQELLQRMTDKCFRKCIGKPGGSLDNSEQVKPGVAGSRAGPGGGGLRACADLIRRPGKYAARAQSAAEAGAPAAVQT